MIVSRRALFLQSLTFFLLVVLLVAAMGASPVGAQAISAPQRGDPLRKVLLNAARPHFGAETGGPVEFVVHRLTVYSGFAFGHVTVQRPGGRKIDWTKTKYAEDIRNGIFDPGASFFLLKHGDNGWGMVDYAVGPTDLTWDGWRQEFQLPIALFTDP